MTASGQTPLCALPDHHSSVLSPTSDSPVAPAALRKMARSRLTVLT